MRPRCILCRNNPPIENSHIVPKFVIKRLKAGNPLKTLVHSNNLGKVYQDGWKEDFLCTDCEQKFSKLETWFCQSIYDPLTANQLGKTNYDDRLGLFTASLGFRYIQLALDRNQHKPVPANVTNLFENLRTSLLNDSFAAISFPVYVQFLCPVTTLKEFPPGINTYFFETIDGGCFEYVIPSKGVFWVVFVKIPGALFVLSERDLKLAFDPPSLVDGYRIHNSGLLDPAVQTGALLGLLKEDFSKRAIEIQENYARMPAARVANVSKKIASLPDKEKYRAHQSFLLDQQLLAALKKPHLSV